VVVYEGVAARCGEEAAACLRNRRLLEASTSCTARTSINANVLDLRYMHCEDIVGALHMLDYT
jgi:hypothetical protein